MCDISLALTGFQTALGAYGQYVQGSAENAAAAYNASLASQEAATHRQLARNEIAKGAAERNRHLRAAAQRQGELTSDLAATGFALDSGSTLSLLAQSAEEEQYDAEIITNNSHMSAWQHEANATNATNRYNAFASQIGDSRSLLGMGGTILGGLAQSMTQFKDLKNVAGPLSGTSSWAKPKIGNLSFSTTPW